MSLAALVLAFAPPALQAERVVVRRASSEIELSTERFELVGSEGDTTEEKELPPQMRRQADELEVVDTYPGGEDPPDSFTRLYSTVQTAFDVGQERAPRSKTVSAGLEGKTVVFERERDGSWTPRCDDPDARPVQLKRLRAELALAPFLPPPADEGAEAPATWELPLAELGRLVSPVEQEVRRPRAKARTPSGGLDLSPAGLSVPIGVLLAAAEGSLKATRLARDDEEEFPERARLEFELRATHDGSATLLGGREGEASDELTLTYRGTGTLAWNPASGAIEIAIEGEARLAESFRAVLEANGARAEVKGELVLGGTLSFEAGERRGE